MITYHKLREKFLDKGMAEELHWFVLPPPMFDNTRLMGDPAENYKTHLKCVQQVYSKDWDYWNTWIDYQQHKF